MNVTFHLHTPPAKAPPPGATPAAPEPVPYIRLEGGEDPTNGRRAQVVDREATPADQRRYPRQWAAFQAEQAKTKAKASPPAETKPAEPKGAGKK